MKSLPKTITDRIARHHPGLAWAVEWPDGTKSSYGHGSPEVTVIFHSKRSLRRLFKEPSLAFGEGYMNGEIEVKGEFSTILRFAFEKPLHDSSPPLPLRAVNYILKLRQRNTSRQAGKNISHHYDLGNEFFRIWLDREMTYSCAYFAKDGCSLEEAQNLKHEHICRKLLLEPGMTLLDIGCGWGALCGWRQPAGETRR